jgi:PAS domain-containing protein
MSSGHTEAFLVAQSERRHSDTHLKPSALHEAILNSAGFSSIATDERGVIRIFNVGAQRMLGRTGDEVLDRMTPAELSDPRELAVRAQLLSVELGRPIAAGVDAMVFKAARGIEDIYEFTGGGLGDGAA